MNHTFKFLTDTATLAVFDPERLRHRVHDAADWWTDDATQLEEVQAGAMALVSLGSDGVYHARITDEELTSDERDYATEVIADLGVEVISGRLYIGPGECQPGGDAEFSASDVERGALVELPPGAYRAEVYAIGWFDSPRWWSEDHRPPEGAPADFVVRVVPRSRPISPIAAEPRFSGLANGFLFDSPTRRVGPEVGMILTTKVRTGAEGLALANCGPCHYRAKLTDYSQVAWKDTIRIRVVAVDHDSKELTGEFVEKVKGA
jgi:hypothetical protein